MSFAKTCKLLIFIKNIKNIKNILERRGEEIMRNLRSFMREEDGMGTVEVVLIIVVLVALVAIFKESIKSLVEKILKKVTDNANKI